jgi:ABC-type branched-subunit amino acid transport system ATPase component
MPPSSFAIITFLAVAAEAAEQLAIMVSGRVALETTAQALLTDESAQTRDLESEPPRR